MSQSSDFIAHYNLTDFASKYKKMQVGTFTNKSTGEEFKSCVFTDNQGELTFCAFSSNLGEQTPRQIASMKDDLQVVQLKSGSYILCRKGHNNWEDVEL